MNYFKNINFNDIKEEHICGDWAIETRFMTLEKAHPHFFESDRMQFSKDGSYHSFNGRKFAGTWMMMREIEMIYNPLINFFEDGKQIGSAIITRLMTNNCVYKLTLYFSTGLELIMEKKLIN